MNFRDLFGRKKPVIACVHLLPLPGAPRYTGDMRAVYATALAEAEIFKRQADGFIVGSYFKKAGKGENRVGEKRVTAFLRKMSSLRRAEEKQMA
jgi:hypothetical protein